jgi:hypothetical protein
MGLRPRPLSGRGRGLDTELVESFEPEGEIEDGGDSRDNSGKHENPSVLGEEESRQAERQENEHEGCARTHHSMPSPLGVGVLGQENGQEHDEGEFHRDGEQDAGAKPLVAFDSGLPIVSPNRQAGLTVIAAWRFSASFTV